MKHRFFAAAIFISMLFSFKGDKPAYQIYDIKGNESTYDKILKDAKNVDIILFGEIHNNPICHWLQLELTKELFNDKKGNLMMGAEMFEADNQIVLNEYLQGKVSEKTLKEEAKLWPNFITDYKPLLDFAKTNHLSFVADNIPRRYANMVYLKGLEKLDSIDVEAKRWICPLPLKYDSTLTCYKEIYKEAGGHGGQNLPKSQAIKDATMAYFILQNWTKGKTFLHFNGTYHSNHHQGIEWYLKQQNPNLKVFTIGSTEQEAIDTLAKTTIGLADYIICLPENMTKTQ